MKKIKEGNFAVFIDVDSDYEGTEYPIGLQTHPVNNLKDAYKILRDKDLITEEDYQKKLSEITTVADIPDVPTGNMPCGTPYFNCDHKEDMFWNLHTKARGKGQWFKKHYKDEPVANWARKNKGKAFYLQYQDMFRKVKAK